MAEPYLEALSRKIAAREGSRPTDPRGQSEGATLLREGSVERTNPVGGMMATDPVDQFLSSYEPEVRELAHGARALVRRLVPDATEKLLLRWKTFAYGRTRKFCAVSPYKAWVNLQFHSGANLPDPSGLLEGTGKSMRHVKVTAPIDLESQALAELIRSAAELAE